jgi:transposase
MLDNATLKRKSFQPLPLPEDDPRWQQLAEQFPDDDLAMVVERHVNRLDPEPLDQAYRRSGSLPFDPTLLLKMVLYQYLLGHTSPATWCREAKLNNAMQWLGRGYVPARRTWYEFRDRSAKFIEQVHQQIITRALEQGLLDPTVGVQDGTTIAACASRHRLVNRPTLEKRTAQLDSILQGTLTGDAPQWVPPTDSGKQDLRERMTQASDVLTQRIEHNALKPSDKRQNPDKIQVSLSDPPAPLGRDKMKVYRPLYTTQYVVALGSLLIMAYGCEPAATDAGTLAPMIDKTQRIVGGRLKTMLTDAAYCTIVDLQECQQRVVELIAPVQANSFTAAKQQQHPPAQIPREQFIWDAAGNCYYCPQGHRLEYVDRTHKRRHSDHKLWEYRYRCDPELCQACPLVKDCLKKNSASRTLKRLEGQELLDAQRKKMADPAIQARYRLRGETVELAFADSKGNRRQTSFHGRGPRRALAETGLMVVAKNLLRIDRLERAVATPLATAA